MRRPPIALIVPAFAPAAQAAPRGCEDPHGAPRRTPIAQDQKSAFLRIDGRVEDVCGGGPCYADAWTGRK